MQLSALLVILPLAAAFPHATAVEARALEARDSCDDARDSCLSGCGPSLKKPLLNPFVYLYCRAKCGSDAQWVSANLSP